MKKRNLKDEAAENVILFSKILAGIIQLVVLLAITLVLVAGPAAVALIQAFPLIVRIISGLLSLSYIALYITILERILPE